MDTSNASAPPAQDKIGRSVTTNPRLAWNRYGSLPPPGSKVPFTVQYVTSRDYVHPCDGGGADVRLGIGKGETRRFGGARAIDVQYEAGAIPVERHQSLILTITGSHTEIWSDRPVPILEATYEVVPFVPKFPERVDGIPLKDCRILFDRFGPEFAQRIVTDPAILDELKAKRFSPEVKLEIVKACQREMKARKNDTRDAEAIIKLLVAVGVKKAKARLVAATYDHTASPYQLALNLTFLQCDRFAKLVDPERAATERSLLLILDEFRDTQHVILSERELTFPTWKNFGVGEQETLNGLNQLVETKVVQTIERPGFAPIEKPEIGMNVAHAKYGDGVIEAKGSTGGAVAGMVGI